MIRLLLLTVCFLILSAMLSQAGADRVSFVVPLRTVHPGQAVSDAGTGRKNFHIKAGFISLYVTDIRQIRNKVARRTLAAGRPIALASLNTPVLVHRGQTAKLVFHVSGLVITALGVAMEPGSAGNFIKLRNIDTGRVIMGAVQEDGTVLVGMQ